MKIFNFKMLVILICSMVFGTANANENKHKEPKTFSLRTPMYFGSFRVAMQQRHKLRRACHAKGFDGLQMTAWEEKKLSERWSESLDNLEHVLIRTDQDGDSHYVAYRCAMLDDMTPIARQIETEKRLGKHTRGDPSRGNRKKDESKYGYKAIQRTLGGSNQ